MRLLPFISIIFLIIVVSGCVSDQRELFSLQNGIGWLDCNQDNCELMISSCNSTTSFYVHQNSKSIIDNYIGKYFNLTYREIEVEHCDIQCIRAPCPDCITVKEIDIIGIEEIDLTSCEQDSECIIVIHAVPGFGCSLEKGFCIENEEYYNTYGFTNDRFRPINENKLYELIDDICLDDIVCEHFPTCTPMTSVDIIGNDYITNSRCIDNICKKIAK